MIDNSLYANYLNYVKSVLREREGGDSVLKIIKPVSEEDFEHYGFILDHNSSLKKQDLLNYGSIVVYGPYTYFFDSRFFYNKIINFCIDPTDFAKRHPQIVDLFKNYFNSLYLKILYDLAEDNVMSNGSLIFTGNLDKLPDGLTVNGDLNLKNCKNILQLPKRLNVSGNLDLRGTNIKNFPTDLIVGESIYINNLIKNIPDNLKSKVVS